MKNIILFFLGLMVALSIFNTQLSTSTTTSQPTPQPTPQPTETPNPPRDEW